MKNKEALIPLLALSGTGYSIIAVIGAFFDRIILVIAAILLLLSSFSAYLLIPLVPIVIGVYALLKKDFDVLVLYSVILLVLYGRMEGDDLGILFWYITFVITSITIFLYGLRIDRNKLSFVSLLVVIPYVSIIFPQTILLYPVLRKRNYDWKKIGFYTLIMLTVGGIWTAYVGYADFKEVPVIYNDTVGYFVPMIWEYPTISFDNVYNTTGIYGKTYSVLNFGTNKYDAGAPFGDVFGVVSSDYTFYFPAHTARGIVWTMNVLGFIDKTCAVYYKKEHIMPQSTFVPVTLVQWRGVIYNQSCTKIITNDEHKAITTVILSKTRSIYTGEATPYIISSPEGFTIYSLYPWYVFYSKGAGGWVRRKWNETIEYYMVMSECTTHIIGK